MRKSFIPLSLFSFCFLALSCISDAVDPPLKPQDPVLPEDPIIAPSLYPQPDGSSLLGGPAAADLFYLVQLMDTSLALEPNPAEVTPQEFALLKQFVDNNLRGATGAETYQNIFGWICKNLKYSYDNAQLRPYDVFVHKTCVCQGYANLMKTLMQTQGYPAFGGNGMLLGYLPHAWAYVFDGEHWWMSDPTNGHHYLMSQWAEGNNTTYVVPQLSDIPLFQDAQFTYGFQEGCLNVHEVKAPAPDVVMVPYSVSGYVLTTFNPQVALPTNVKTLVLGANIEKLAPYISTLQEYTPGVEEVMIDPENPYLHTYKGVVYQNGSDLPYYIPTAIRSVELKPLETIEKNTLVYLSQVEEIRFAEGTRYIEGSAIEFCPNLQRVYVPHSVESIDPQALYNCNPSAEIIYY